MTFIINQLVLAVFNYVNSRIDAYRILQNKTIAHAVNFLAYALTVALLMWLFRMEFWPGVLFSISAFFNRQLSFDIPLNLRRGLPWYYQSTANPPQALMDRVEKFLFPSGDGKVIAVVYGSCFIIFTVIGVVWLH